FPPGAVLPEAFLAQEFDVSRTPIREALKQLQHEGLVEIRPKVGTFVREPTRREIIELFQLKESMEGLAASLLARRGEVAELAVLRRNL
ncbi:GntR family transcriptional regulator, partial [Pantoea sp. SIMBA_072]